MNIGWKSIAMEGRATRSGELHLNAGGLNVDVSNKYPHGTHAFTSVVEKYPGDAKSSGEPIESRAPL